jgi:SHS family sialic acid transporter-like MFS transporter
VSNPSSTQDLPLALAHEASALSRGRWLVLVAAFLGWMFDGLEMGIFPLIARSALGKLLAGAADENTIKWWHQVIDACFLFGAALGGLVFGWLGDRIGRVKAMSFSILVYSGFTGLLYFVTSPAQIAGLRFVAAIGMGGEWALGVALVMEVWDAKHRPLLAGMIGAAANVGMVSVAIIALFLRVTENNWRLFALIGAAPALLTFVIRIFVPESPKWQRAQAVAPSRPIKELFGSPQLRGRALLAILFASIALLGTWGAVQKVPAWVGRITPKGSIAPAVVQIALATGAIVGCMIAPYIAAIFNRRIVYSMLCLGSLIVCQILFLKFTTYNAAFVAMTFLVGVLTAAIYGWLPLYLPELFPTRVRATAQGIAFNFGRILAGGGALWGGTIGGSYEKMGAALSLVYIAGVVCIWLAPETKGRPMPD